MYKEDTVVSNTLKSYLSKNPGHLNQPRNVRKLIIFSELLNQDQNLQYVLETHHMQTIPVMASLYSQLKFPEDNCNILTKLQESGLYSIGRGKPVEDGGMEMAHTSVFLGNIMCSAKSQIRSYNVYRVVLCLEYKMQLIYQFLMIVMSG